MKKFDITPFLKKIEQYHRLFYAVLGLGNPVWCESIKTASVGYNESNNEILFLINKDFFDKLNEETKLFVLAHEALHIFFSHIERKNNNQLDSEISHIAQDIVINELLIKEFGFNRNSLNFGFNICFIDTVFAKEDIKKYEIKSGQSFEYYYDLLIKNKSNIKMQNLVDEHIKNKEKNKEKLSEEGIKDLISIPEELSEDIKNYINSVFNQKEIKDLKNKIGGVSNKIKTNLKSVVLEDLKIKEDKWTSIVKNKIASLLKNDIRNCETWIDRPKRLVNMDENIFVPNVKEYEVKVNHKYNLFFFLDSSGSCLSYSDIFFNIVRTIPRDKFNINLYCFDDRVTKLDINENYIEEGYGTNYSIIEDEIQKEINNGVTYNKSYPDLVFVLTDGHGTRVNPQKPKNWYWILTENYKNYIPPESTIISISKFGVDDKMSRFKI